MASGEIEFHLVALLSVYHVFISSSEPHARFNADELSSAATSRQYSGTSTQRLPPLVVEF
jgi:hypothetical protein